MRTLLRNGLLISTKYRISARLTANYGKGFSQRNLEQMRQFFLIYSKEISQTVSAEFTLSYSHYLFLMRIDNPDERKFYEIEAKNSNWSLRELKRQFDSALYERLAVSKDKESVRELSKKGWIVLCKKKSDSLVEITLPEGNSQIFASKYQTVLPNKEQLIELIEEK